jgi:hypothetical protein
MPDAGSTPAGKDLDPLTFELRKCSFAWLLRASTTVSCSTIFPCRVVLGPWPNLSHAQLMRPGLPWHTSLIISLQPIETWVTLASGLHFQEQIAKSRTLVLYH